MRRAALNHPSRAILIHVPAVSLEHLDAVAREGHVSRSEVIRQLLAPPVELRATPLKEAMANELALKGLLDGPPSENGFTRPQLRTKTSQRGRG
jgi:Ribbon-helix-helix protein, copG family